MENRKRKRESEVGAPRVKYHVEQLGRSFERILKEDSHEELRSVVRKKLGLDDATRLELVQLREGRFYDLEDDDDFEAFKAAAVAYSSLDVRVSFLPHDAANTTGDIGEPAPQEASTSHEPSEKLGKDHQKRQKKRISVPGQTIQDPNIVRTPSDGMQKVVPSLGGEEDIPIPTPPKKKRKKGSIDVAEPGTTSKAKPKNVKGKDTETGRSNQEQEQEPPKKKRKKATEIEASIVPQDLPTPVVPVETVSLSKKSTHKKASKIADSRQDAPERKRAKKKDVHTPVPEVPISAYSAPPPVPSSHVSASSPDAVAPSPPSKPTASDLLQKHSRSAEEITASFESRRVITKQQEMAEMAAKEIKGKEKAQAGVRAGKSRLRESWVPGENNDASSPLRSEEVSSWASGSPHPPSAASHAAAITSEPAPSVIPVPIAVLAPSPAPVPTPAPTPASRVVPYITAIAKKAAASSCPICLARPFHYQYLCPLIQLGSLAIQKRMKELEEEGGRSGLVEELSEWLAKEKHMRKVVGKSNTRANAPPTVVHTQDFSDQSQKRAQGYVGQLSEVAVESRNEGSEDEGSTSGSGSSSEDEKNGGKTSQTARSKSDVETTSGSSLKSGAGLESKSSPVDLDNVDLEAIIRGPVVKVQLATLGDEDDSDSTEDEASLLEEEEESQGKKPGRNKGWKVERSSSEGVSGDEDQESDGESEELGPEKSTIPDKVNISTGNGGNKVKESSQGNTEASGSSAGATVADKSALQRVSGPDSSPVSQGMEEATRGLDATTLERLKTPTSEPSEPSRTVLPPTTPKGPPTLHTTADLRSPIVQKMKDKFGNSPLNLPDNNGTVLPMPPTVDDTSTSTPEEEIAQPYRGRSYASSQAKSTTRSTRSRSRTAPPTNSDPASSDAVPKRRGRPPLSEAVKAERRAIKEAEKAARAAEKLEKKRASRALVPGNARRKTSEPDAVSSQSQVGGPLISTSKSAGPPWTTLAPSTGYSVVSQSSSAVDQLMSSSPAVDVNKDLTDLEDAATPGRVNGIKSPGAVSVTTSASRRHDEHDVEQIVGSPKVSDKKQIPPPTRQPLFLPGASQMTQTQTIHHQTMDEQVPAAPDERTDSDTSSDTEADGGEHDKIPQTSMLPRLSLPSKATFPSLSQLSFDKFRPSFLLPGRGSSQSQVKSADAQPDDESESDDEDSSDEEKHSHIPKGKVAGTGVIKKRKSRGLLHA